MQVLERRRGGAHDDGLPADARRIDPAPVELGEGDGRHRAGRAAEVDPGPSVAEGRLGQRAARAPRGGDGDRAQPAGRVVHPADHPARVGREVAHRGGRADLGQPVVAAQDGGVATPVGLAGGQDGAARALDGLEQGQVLALARRLGELDVVDDLAGAGLAQPVDRSGVARARERPLQAEVGERRVVDLDDQELGGRRGPAHTEAVVDGVVLEPGHGPGQARADAGDGDERPGGEDRRCPPPPAGGAQPSHPRAALASRAR